MEATGTPFLDPEDCFDRSCSNCKKPGSTSFCSRCAVSDIGHVRVFYCSKSCQQEHWKTHKETCKSIRQLHRATSLMADIWSMIETDYCPISAEFVGEVDGVITTVTPDEGVDRRGLRGISVLTPVTSHPIPEELAPTIQAAVFAMQQFSSLGTTAKPILEMIFNDICYLVEMKSAVKDQALIVRFDDKHNEQHSFLMVTLHTGETFVLDFDGIMHGWKQLLYPKDAYVKHRTTGDLQSSHFGRAASVQKDILSTKTEDSIPRAIVRFSDHAVKFICDTITSVMKKEGLAMADFLALPDEKFAPIRERLIAGIQACIRRVKGLLEDKGWTRVYYDKDFNLHVAMNDDVKAKFEKVWLTRKQYRPKKHNWQAMKDRYQRNLAVAQQDQ